MLLVAAGVAAYANSLHGPLVFDDLTSIGDDASIRHLWPPWAPLKESTRPTAAWTFAVNYALGGLRVEGYHAVNLLIHLSAGLVLLGVARRTLKPYFASSDWLALAIALLWTVHPLQTEAVTYIVQRQEALMGLFYLLTLYGFIRATGTTGILRVPARTGGPTFGRCPPVPPNASPASTLHPSSFILHPFLWYALSVACCALGMGSQGDHGDGPAGGALVRPGVGGRLVARDFSAAVEILCGVGVYLGGAGHLHGDPA